MKEKTQVLIAGAGPTGLVLALWLKKRGIDFRIIDKSSGPGETSRALAVQARTLEFYRQLGIDDKLTAAGISVQEIVLRRAGKVAARAQLGALGQDISPYPYLLFCSQDVHEEILVAELKRLGVEVERQSELLSFTQDEKNVTAQLRTPRGLETVTAEYLCGCDGAHSTVRRDIGTGFPGGTYEQIFFVADVQATGEAATEGGLQISITRSGFCIVMPIQTKGTIRLTGVVPQIAEKKDKVAFSDVAESVTSNTGLTVNKVNWFSTYHVHHRVADNFRRGRVFLSGDAGHIHSPAGGQGMNTGIGDAVNLAWKLAEVLKRRGSTRLLESYEPERIAFARVLVQTTDSAFRFISTRSWVGSAFRMYVMPNLFALLTRSRAVLRMIFLTVSQARIKYRQSFISQGGEAGEIHAGDRLPYVKNSLGDNYSALKSLDWQIHIYGQAQQDLQVHAKNLGVTVHEYEWSSEAAAQGLLRDALYLIRPDGYVALASEVQAGEKVRAYFSYLFGG